MEAILCRCRSSSRDCSDFSSASCTSSRDCNDIVVVVIVVMHSSEIVIARDRNSDRSEIVVSSDRSDIIVAKV